MAVDLHEYKFILELERLARFDPADPDKAAVWTVNFPAWRAPFTAHLLRSHASHYRLPDFQSFAQTCKVTWTDERYQGKYDKWFSESLYDQTEQRLRFFYESGMAETYLYCCLVDAIEDMNRDGFVFYDARMDWKQKGDVWIVSRGRQIVIDAFMGTPDGRGAIRLERDENEREQKKNTDQSSAWGNSEHERWHELQIGRGRDDVQVINGVRIFSIQRVNQLLRQIYVLTGKSKGFYFPVDKRKRREL